ncbi:MAG: amylo-alpha-1,6-glucosidase [Ignavibacteria bacterium]|jgi:hypothetical protein
MKLKSLYLYFILIFSLTLYAQGNSELEIISEKEVGQIEVGGPYVGIEIHKSFPMINRVSFYYPVANSIDISEDYWKRENYRIMSMGIKAGDSPKYLLENEVYKVTQSPYAVEFYKEKYESGIDIKYEFCKDIPALVATIKVTNNSGTTKNYEVYTRYEAVLRTCHTYALTDQAYTSFDENGEVLKINYDNIETGNAQLLFLNAGEKPEYYTSSSYAGEYKNLDEYWLNTDKHFDKTEISKPGAAKPSAGFVYKKELKPGETIEIVQVIGSVKKEESNSTINYLLKNYKKEIAAYKDYILGNSRENKVITTNNPVLDFTSSWAKAVLTTNNHFIDGDIVPMPAQAEYNFYFTHDALLTDLAAVNFDLERVKNDLQFIIKHADSNKVIPHAYYWKDKEFKTEFAGTENWNHFWFVMLCARYLRHSNDIEFTNILYPYIQKSIETALKNKGEDDLMYSFRPDWWDIGNNFGPRAYMTILAIRALREFNFVSTALNKDQTGIKFYEELAGKLHKNLHEKLWDDNLDYLISYYEDGKKDTHIYMGSLLASHFNLLDNEKNMKLLNTAKKYLLDEKIGIYTLFPMDLHELIDYMGFAGNEAGDPYHYGNGGIWPHGNAWYALTLINNNMKDEAFEFINKTMTINGIINSPNGQPAMYEYRISDKTNPAVYGKIDKPQFLWAGGWYFYTLYNLFGVRENEWNISFEPYLNNELEKINFSLTINGKSVPVEISGLGDYISAISFEEISIPSAVIPADVKDVKKINVEIGKSSFPYLNSANAKVYSPSYNSESKTLEFTLKSFEGHEIEFEVISPFEVLSVFANGKGIKDNISSVEIDGVHKIKIKQQAEAAENFYSIKFR